MEFIAQGRHFWREARPGLGFTPTLEGPWKAFLCVGKGIPAAFRPAGSSNIADEHDRRRDGPMPEHRLRRVSIERAALALAASGGYIPQDLPWLAI
jgi:hypothetical protein